MFQVTIKFAEPNHKDVAVEFLSGRIAQSLIEDLRSDGRMVRTYHDSETGETLRLNWSLAVAVKVKSCDWDDVPF